MHRLEIALWTVVTLALIFASQSKADHLYTGPPVRDAYALSIELSREAAALSYDVERLLCHCDEYDDVLDELCDVADELCDLNSALRAAAIKPRKWNRICRRAEDVVEEVCELDEEIHEAVDDLNRDRYRRTGFAPHRTARGFAVPRLGCELVDRVHRMRALAEAIHRLAHAG